MNREPEFLVQTSSGMLHAYFNLDILLIDVSLRREEKVTLFKKIPGMRTQISYEPKTEAELRAEYEASKVRDIR